MKGLKLQLQSKRGTQKVCIQWLELKLKVDCHPNK